MSISIPAITNSWTINTPELFRYMNASFVEDFFKDGSIRISSFDEFRKHKDEQRLDMGEGRIMVAHNFPSANQGKGQAITSWILYDRKAYVLSTSVVIDKNLMESFGTDSYLRIHDSTNFGIEVARQIPGFIMGLEGFCLYQHNKIFYQDLSLDLRQFQKDPNKAISDMKLASNGIEGQIDEGEYDMQRLGSFLVNNARHYPLYLKDERFRMQCEYRFIWLTNIATQDHLSLKIPEAIRYCSRPNWLVE
jgi:hypothetical protein